MCTGYCIREVLRCLSISRCASVATLPGEILRDLCRIAVLGTSTREEIRCMNPNYTDFRFPQIKAHPWHKLEACAHPFFDELREPGARLPNGRPLPPLFNFKQEVCN
ncbi:hypothetical protein Sjap_026126 [Stephania japonica]|uniref:Uncharacterized protein n=1 Tax=Stephania japonica TaxID=461633 RepID=A0AAP0E5I4_9MAGN